MGAAVRIESEAWGDLRFAALARACGFADLEHALIKMARIWAWQTEHFTFESPTYVVDIDLIESVLGDGGAAKLVRARLAEEVPGGYRIKGGTGRIEWLCRLRRNSAAGVSAKRVSKAAKADTHQANQVDVQAVHHLDVKADVSLDVPLTPTLTTPRSDPSSSNLEDRARARAPTEPVSAQPALVLVGAGAPKQPRKRAAAAHAMPEGWTPTPAEIPAGVNAAAELAQFRDHHAAKGSTFVDWNAAWRLWLRNAVKFSARAGPAPPRAPDARFGRAEPHDQSVYAADALTGDRL